MQCENGMTYKECGQVCADAVYENSTSPNFGCEMQCMDGCHCPDDTKLWRGVCVPEVNCSYDGMEVPPGILIDGCKNW